MITMAEYPGCCDGCASKFHCSIVETDDPGFIHGCPCSVCIIKQTCNSICDERVELRQRSMKYSSEVLTDGKRASFLNDSQKILDRMQLRDALEKMEKQDEKPL